MSLDVLISMDVDVRYVDLRLWTRIDVYRCVNVNIDELCWSIYCFLKNADEHYSGMLIYKQKTDLCSIDLWETYSR